MDLAQSTKIIPGQMVTPDFGKFGESFKNVSEQQRLNLANQASLLGLQKEQQGIVANEVISGIMKQSIDPNTGEVDQNKAFTLIAQDPRVAYNFPTIANQINQTATSQEAAKQARIETSVKQIGYMNSQLGSLRLTKNLDYSNIVEMLAKAVQDKVITVQQAQREISDLPKDKKDLSAWVDDHYIKTNTAQQNIDLYLPTEEIIDPNTNQKIKVSKAQLMGLQKTNPSIVPINISAPIVALNPSEQSALQTTGTNQANAVQELHSNVSTAPTRINILESARANLDNPDLSTGPGVEGRNQVKSFFNALAPEYAQKIFGKDFNGTIKDTDEFKKYMASYTNAASANLGSGTDARLNAAISGNANITMNKMANQDIITKTIAIEKMNQAQDLAWNKSGISPDKFNAWQSDFNKKVKPEVFAFDSMTPKQQQDFVTRKTKDGTLAAFKKDLMSMVQQGLIEAPGR